jgi:hypothetical protein
MPTRRAVSDSVNDRTSLIRPASPASGVQNSGALSVSLEITARAKESVYDAVVRVCGASQSNSYFVELEKRSGLGASTTFDFERNISIPVCSAANSRYMIVETKQGDTVWKLYADLKASRSSWSWKDFDRPANTSDLGERSEYFLDVFRLINPWVPDINNLNGATVVVPVAPLTDAIASSAPAVDSSDRGPQPIFALQSDNRRNGCPRLVVRTPRRAARFCSHACR